MPPIRPRIDRARRDATPRRRLRGVDLARGAPLAKPRVLLGVLGALVLGLPGCFEPPAADPRLRIPTLHFDAAALRRLASVSARLEGTPLGHASLRILDGLGDCAEVFGRSDPAAGETRDPAPPVLDCARGSAGGDVAWAGARRGDADGWLTWPIGLDGHLELHFEVDPHGGLDVAGSLRPPRSGGGLDLLLPGEGAPADSVLDPRALLLHARGRPPGGLGLARLVPSGGQADRLFALKGRLLEGALLRGTWELAFVAPPDGGSRPLPMIALHHRGTAPIQRALDEALGQLEATWPIRRTPRRFDLADGVVVEGGCYAELPLLPELAPCWAVTETALLVGYRAAALEAARGLPAVSSAPGAPVGTRLVVHLDRMHALDRRRADEDAGPVPGALYRKLEVELARDEADLITIRAALRRTDA